MAVKGTIVTKDVKEYRKIPRLSQSDLKLYIENRKKFYKKVILKELVDNDESDAINIGNLVDVMLTDDENFEHYFYISSAPKPTGQMLIFVKNLESITKGSLDEDGQCTTTFFERSNLAYKQLKESNGGKLRDSYDKFIKNFEEWSGYYKELLECTGKQVVTPEEVELSARIVDSLKTSLNTAHIVNNPNLYKKVAILYDYKGREFKSELDLFEVNDDEKYIQPYDYKTTAFVEWWVTKYLDNKYYLQGALYKIAITAWAEQNGYEDYEIRDMKFICADSINYYKPLIYEMGSDNFEDALNGFSINGRNYKGLNQIIDDLTISEETGEWGMSADNIRTKGIVSIPTYEKYKSK